MDEYEFDKYFQALYEETIFNYIDTHMTEEKIKEIESRSNYFLFLKRNGINSWEEYFKLCEDEELPEITREAWVMFYLEEMAK